MIVEYSLLKLEGSPINVECPNSMQIKKQNNYLLPYSQGQPFLYQTPVENTVHIAQYLPETKGKRKKPLLKIPGGESQIQQ